MLKAFTRLPPTRIFKCLGYITLLFSSFSFSLEQSESNPADFAWLAYAGSTSVYQPNAFSRFGEQYVINGFITNNLSATRVNIPGRCGVGLEKNAELCYTPCKTGFTGAGLIGPLTWQKASNKSKRGDVYQYLNPSNQEIEYLRLLKNGTYDYFPLNKKDTEYWHYMFK